MSSEKIIRITDFRPEILEILFKNVRKTKNWSLNNEYSWVQMVSMYSLQKQLDDEVYKASNRDELHGWPNLNSKYYLSKLLNLCK